MNVEDGKKVISQHFYRALNGNSDGEEKNAIHPLLTGGWMGD